MRTFNATELLIIIAIVAILSAASGSIAGHRAAKSQFAEIIDGHLLVQGDLTVTGNVKIEGYNLEIGANGTHPEPNITFRYGPKPSSYGYFALYSTNPTGPAYEIDTEIVLENDLKTEGIVYVSERILFGDHLGDQFWALSIDESGNLTTTRIDNRKAATDQHWNQYP